MSYESANKMDGCRPAGESANRIVDGRRIGQLAHVIIGELLSAGLRRPSPREIWSVVAGHSVFERCRYRQAARQQLIAAASVYFRLFEPGDDWSVEQLELLSDRTRFDVVWRSGDSWRVDEIKSGRVGTVLERNQLDDQLKRQLAAGVQRWEESFSGVRVVILGAPSSSFVATPDGERVPVSWGSGA